jgi:hypothetical protein
MSQNSRKPYQKRSQNCWEVPIFSVFHKKIALDAPKFHQKTSQNSPKFQKKCPKSALNTTKFHQKCSQNCSKFSKISPTIFSKSDLYSPKIFPKIALNSPQMYQNSRKHYQKGPKIDGRFQKIAQQLEN